MTFPETSAAEMAGYRSQSAAQHRQGVFARLFQLLMFLFLFAGFGMSSLLVAALIQVCE